MELYGFISKTQISLGWKDQGLIITKTPLITTNHHYDNWKPNNLVEVPGSHRSIESTAGWHQLRISQRNASTVAWSAGTGGRLQSHVLFFHSLFQKNMYCFEEVFLGELGMNIHNSSQFLATQVVGLVIGAPIHWTAWLGTFKHQQLCGPWVCRFISNYFEVPFKSFTQIWDRDTWTHFWQRSSWILWISLLISFQPWESWIFSQLIPMSSSTFPIGKGGPQLAGCVAGPSHPKCCYDYWASNPLAWW